MQTVKILPLISVALLLGCDSQGLKDQIQNTVNQFNSANVFPTAVAVASPTEISADYAIAAKAGPRAGSSPAATRYAWAIQRMEKLLDGTTPVRDVFDPENFLERPANAACFGPSLLYENHPDGTDAPPFTVPGGVASPYPGLPTGDLGIWTDMDSATGHACAAAQLNSQMRAISQRSMMALMSLAAMLSAAYDAGGSLPTAGTTQDYLSAMTGLAVPNVRFTQATLSLNSGADTWTYALAFEYTDGSARAHTIALDLVHKPGTGSAISYEGMLSYQVDDYFAGGHCPDSNVTYNGTLYYDRSSATSMLVNARDGMYCGHGTAAATAADTGVEASGTYALIDPAVGYPASAQGWANNFSMLGAQFDPTTLEGDYVYAWQAGANDPNSRILNVGMNYDATTEVIDGEAYFGFGDPVATTDGSVQGFFCNWAGPGADHRIQNYAQRQFIEFNSVSGYFEVPAAGSDIVYAPTNACTYEGSPAGFWYDRNLDGTQDETNGDMYVYAVAPDDVSMGVDLMGPQDTDGDTVATMPEAIANRGFTLPPL